MRIPETHRTVRPGPETYSTRKVALERRLLDGARGPLFILRPGAIHGVGSRHPREWWFVKRPLDGRRHVPVAYQGGLGLHTSAAANIAGLVSTVLPLNLTTVLNAVDPSPPTVREIGAYIAGHLGRDIDFVDLPHPHPKGMLGETPWSTATPFITSDAAARALGYQPEATYQEAVAPFCDWLVAQAEEEEWRLRYPAMASYLNDPFNYAAEDDLLASLGRL